MVFVLRISYTTAYDDTDSIENMVLLFSTYALAQQYYNNFMASSSYARGVNYEIQQLNIDDINSGINW